MALYTFYPKLQSGAALAFEVAELDDEAQIIAFAEGVCRRHPSCIEVEVWDEARLVHSVKGGVVRGFRPSVGDEA